MSTRVVEWLADMPSLGDAVVAIGVFDGVHIGHRTLLQATAAEAHLRGASAVAVTFDCDPDQVVSPESAAPQLLTLADKLRYITDAGIDTVLVIPFTPYVAAMSPEVFLEHVLTVAMRPIALHVGRDFRFGSRALGDLKVLEQFGAAHAFTVTGHDLVEIDGRPITSTRIRGLVASGEIQGANVLLGRPHRVCGTVRRGRGDGARLGFPTANILPEPYAALPADGVYAGRVVLSDGYVWASAVSVGTPPTFPDAGDYLEAHVIGFDGDLYDQNLTVEFLARLRPQRAFASLSDLTEAIGRDVAHALDIAGFDSAHDESGIDTAEEPGGGFVADPAALAAAERAVRKIDHSEVFEGVDEKWVELLGPTIISGLTGSAGLNGFRITSPLEAAGIPFTWQPYAPEEMPAYRPAYGAVDRPFTLFVPKSYLESAREALITEGSVEGDLFEDMVPDDWPAQGDGSTSFVQDPALLAAAEETARLQAETEDGEIDWDSWMPVLIDQPYDRRRLLGLEFALQSVGIPVKWDPFSPARTGMLDRGFFKRPEFTLAVPSDRFDEAQDIIEQAEAAAE